MASISEKVQLNVRLNYERATKGTFVYQNTELGAPVPHLYIKKGAFKGEPPRAIQLVVLV